MPDILYKAGFIVSFTDTIRKYQIHIICWLIFIIYEMSMLTVSMLLLPWLVYLLFYSTNILLFYFHSRIVLERTDTRGILDFVYITFLISLELAVYCLITYLFTILFKNLEYAAYQDSFFQRRYVIGTIWRGISFILYGTGYYYVVRYNERKERMYKQDIENEKLKNEVLRAEQDFLRAQINPHLLFNTLSFIKYAAKKNPEEADQAVMRLSGIMSFALESNTQTIRLTRELEQVENIIELNQLRFNHKLNIRYCTQLENTQVSIIPIVLLTLVENIFKHGNVQEEAYPALISVNATSEHIIIETTNLPNQHSHAISNNTGLANIKLRLDQAYQDQYEFVHGLSDNLFKVYIKIKLHNN